MQKVGFFVSMNEEVKICQIVYFYYFLIFWRCGLFLVRGGGHGHGILESGRPGLDLGSAFCQLYELGRFIQVLETLVKEMIMLILEGYCMNSIRASLC